MLEFAAHLIRLIRFIYALGGTILIRIGVYKDEKR
jgi:hypothetical protein